MQRLHRIDRFRLQGAEASGQIGIRLERLDEVELGLLGDVDVPERIERNDDAGCDVSRAGLAHQ